MLGEWGNASVSPISGLFSLFRRGTLPRKLVERFRTERHVWHCKQTKRILFMRERLGCPGPLNLS